MCDYFLQRMEGDQAGGGDLTDIVRAGGAMPGNNDGDGNLPSTAAEWQLQPADQQLLFPPPPPSASPGTGGDVFGDPFAGLGDPFSSDYSSGAPEFLEGMPDAMAKIGFEAGAGGGVNGCGGGGGGGQMFDMGRKPLLPRGMQMMPAGIGGGMGPRLMQSSLSPIAIRPYPAMTAGDMLKLGITPGQAAGCAIDAAVTGMQMSSPRNNNSGIKRRLEPGNTYRHRIYRARSGPIQARNHRRVACIPHTCIQ